MTYQKTTWKNRLVERPGTYTLRQNADGSVTLLSAEGNVMEEGTPVNAENLNKIEQALFDLFTTSPVDESRLTELIQNLDGWGGYRKLPGGLILQWGKIGLIPVNTQTTVKFGIEFPNSCFGVFPTAYSSNQATANIDYFDKIQFKVRQFNDAGGKNIYWFAIGC